MPPTFARALNKVKPSLIRIEADEVTYNLHIIVRYELEKAMINGDLTIESLPGLWNAKYREYLDIEPTQRFRRCAPRYSLVIWLWLLPELYTG